MAWRVLPGFSISYYDMKYCPARTAGGNAGGGGVVYTEKRRGAQRLVDELLGK